jgi:UDP-glucose 4-epimerase
MLAASEPAERCSGRVYNVAGGNRYTLLDVLGILEDQIGNRPARNHVETRAGDVRHSQADISAAIRDLRFQPQVDLRHGLERTVSWAGVGATTA